MKKSRFTEQQILGFLKEAEAGMPVKELCRKHGFSDAAFYGWRSKFGGLQVNQAKRLRELEAENAKLRALGRGAFGCRSPEGRLRGKALSPQAKRQVVARMRTAGKDLGAARLRTGGDCALDGAKAAGRGRAKPGAAGADHRSSAGATSVRLSAHPRSAAP